MTAAAPPLAEGAAGTGAVPEPGSSGFSPWFTPLRIALIVWTAMSIVAVIAQWHAIQILELSDTDDAMRMAQVRDLLAGQGWWDLTQYRVNPAGGGVLMHWSRIVDAPIALGVWFLKPLLGQALAEQVVMTVWPPLLGAALSVACALGYRNLPDKRIAYVAPLYLVTAGFIVVQLRPLRVDHHGWQIFLAMLILWQALRPASRQAGLIAGACGAALLAISIEGLPVVALFAGLCALRWALHARADDRTRLTGYMAGLAGGALFFQFLTRGPMGLAGRWCDSLSAPYLGAFAIAAVAVLAIAAVDSARRWVRFAALGGAGVLAAAALVAIEPLCAAGPFATLDPIVVHYWYRNVLEGQPVWASPPHTIFFVVVPWAVGLIGSLLAWRAGKTAEDRRAWTTVIVALAGASALSLLVLRSAGTAHLFAIPGSAWLGLRGWLRARQQRRDLAHALHAGPCQTMTAAQLTLGLLEVAPDVETLKDLESSVVQAGQELRELYEAQLCLFPEGQKQLYASLQIQLTRQDQLLFELLLAARKADPQLSVSQFEDELLLEFTKDE
ncbi:MAG: hypothetical protein IE934_15755, partial [Sphingopyxis sp.]|nr:hypothetical protein [Sphingopyxis sp.]